MTHPRNHHEREFEAFLAGEESELARLYRRLPQSEPDARLDAAVLALARAAVEPQRVNALRHANVRHRRPLWLVALSSAAGVVLATGIAWQMRNGFNESAAPTLQQSASARTERDVIPISAIVPPAEPAAPPAPPPEAPAIASTTAAMPAPPPAKPASLKPKAPAQRREVELAAAIDAKKDNSLRSDDRVPADTSPPERVAAATAQPSAEPLARAGLAEAESTKGSGVDKLAADAAQPQPFPGTAGVPDYNSVERKAAIASGSRRDDYGVDVDAASADPLAKQEQRARVARSASKEKRTVEETTARPQSASGAERQVAPSIAAAPPVAASAAAPAAEAPPANVSQAPAHSDAASAVGNAASAELKRNATLAPDEWIKRIRELLRQERRADALENLELLRRKHPTYVVPADLRDLRDLR
ncbi:hypothetical protein [Tahibacter sp.]|uniref:hypothetical protein n=1 Tax=Tahibacter sp. TaxID=2056211 RepID=UPI0028C50689|nr:hypothetical protein [Tahibacter sp.]